MKYTVILLVIIIFWQSCKTSVENNTIESKSDGKNNITDINETSYPISEPLLHYVDSFCNVVDSIPNPFNRETVYLLLFNKRAQDTTIEIFADISALIVKEEQRNDYEVKGICFLNQKPIIVYDFVDGIGSHLYNVEALSKEHFNNYTVKDSNDSLEAWTFVAPHLKMKLIKQDSIIILHSNTYSGIYDYF